MINGPRILCIRFLLNLIKITFIMKPISEELYKKLVKASKK